MVDSPLLQNVKNTLMVCSVQHYKQSERDRQRDRETDRERARETGRDRERKKEREIDIGQYGNRCKQSHREVFSITLNTVRFTEF